MIIAKSSRDISKKLILFVNFSIYHNWPCSRTWKLLVC